MRRLCSLFLLVATICWSAHPARAYTLQYTDAVGGAQVRWSTGKINLSLSPSLGEAQSNIKPGSDVYGAARRAYKHWAEAANIEFNEVPTSARSISAAGGTGDGVSLLTVAHTLSNTIAFNGLSSEMAARTRVFYTESGSITEADIALNPTQKFSTDGTPGTYDLEATFTHEIGHLLGLEHSATIGATMQPRQGRNGIYNLSAWSPRTLSEDDRAGVRAIYGLRPGATPRGAVTGRISYAGGAPAFGVNVWAEDAATGMVSASNITLASGVYRIDELLPGRYRILVGALDGPIIGPEIASQRGAYAALTLNSPPSFRTIEAGTVTVKAGTAIALNAQLLNERKTLNPAFVGLDKQLSTIAVPLAPGQTFTVYVGGEGVSAELIAQSGVSVTSPFLTVSPESVVEQKFGDGLSVISFDVSVAANAPPGQYSVRLQSSAGEVAYLVGCLTIDEVGSVPSFDPELGRTLTGPATDFSAPQGLETDESAALLAAGD